MKRINRLNVVLKQMESLEDQGNAAASKSLEFIDSSLRIFTSLTTLDYPEKEEGHVIYNCRKDLQVARQLVNTGSIENGVQIAKSTISYFLKQDKK